MKSFTLGTLVGLVVGAALIYFITNRHNFFPPVENPEPIDTTKGGTSIDLATANKWVFRYKEEVEVDDNYVRASYFSKEFIRNNFLKDDDEIVGLNIYIGRDDSGLLQLLLVGVGKSPESEGIDLTDVNRYIIGASEMRCPNNCDKLSALIKTP